MSVKTTGMPETTSALRKSALRAAGLFVALVAGLAVALSPALSQAPDAAPDPAQVDAGKRVWSGRAGCYNCHGWAGNGAADFNFPQGANLRETAMDAPTLVEVISCGLPGTGMPYHVRTAYADRPCYGQTAAQLGLQMPPPGAFLSPSQLAAVAAYIVARIKDRGPITRAECQEYFGGEPQTCLAYE